jgi:hypothetical protein
MRLPLIPAPATATDRAELTRTVDPEVDTEQRRAGRGQQRDREDAERVHRRARTSEAELRVADGGVAERVMSAGIWAKRAIQLSPLPP